jgi:hypothetical protein
VVQHPHCLPQLPERHAGGRVDVGHRADVRSRGVDSGVDPELGVRDALSGQDVAVQVQDQQTLGPCQGRARARREQEAGRVGYASADVAVGTDQPGLVNDLVRQRDLSAKRREVRGEHALSHHGRLYHGRESGVRSWGVGSDRCV